MEQDDGHSVDMVGQTTGPVDKWADPMIPWSPSLLICTRNIINDPPLWNTSDEIKVLKLLLNKKRFFVSKDYLIGLMKQKISLNINQTANIKQTKKKAQN